MKLTNVAEPHSTGSRFSRRAGAVLLAATLLFSLTPTVGANAVTDIEFGGRAYVDLNKDGYVTSQDEMFFNPDGVAVQLYKEVGGTLVPEGEPQAPSQLGNSAGRFLFTSLEPDVLYKVKPIITNPQVGVIPSALDSEGFLKYSGEYMEENNPWDSSTYLGSSEFVFGEGKDQTPGSRTSDCH